MRLLWCAELTKNPVDGFSAGLVDDSYVFSFHTVSNLLVYIHASVLMSHDVFFRRNLFEWAVTILGPPDTLYEGGFFNAVLKFPKDYPQSPPECRFTSDMWHPNVFPDGRVCISILHPPGFDPMNPQEDAAEKWSPVHTVESIVLSIISMLSSPNDESPANIDAAKDWRENRAEFKKKVAKVVRKSQEML